MSRFAFMYELPFIIISEGTQRKMEYSYCVELHLE